MKALATSPSLEWFKNLESDDGFESLKLDFALELERAIEASGMSRTEIASALGVSSARVTNILRGDSNLTMNVMARLAHALGKKINIKFEPKAAEESWSRPVTGKVISFPNPRAGSNVHLNYAISASHPWMEETAA